MDTGADKEQRHCERIFASFYYFVIDLTTRQKFFSFQKLVLDLLSKLMYVRGGVGGVRKVRHNRE